MMNIYDSCRICLIEYENLSPLTIYSDALWGKLLNLSSDLQDFSLPDKVCSGCAYEFQTVLKFLEKCEKSNAVLRKHCQNNTQFSIPEANEFLDETNAFSSYTSKVESPLIDSVSKEKILSADSGEFSSLFNVKLDEYNKTRHMTHRKKPNLERQLLKRLKKMSIRTENREFGVNADIVQLVNKTNIGKNRTPVLDSINKDYITTQIQWQNIYHHNAQGLPTGSPVNCQVNICGQKTSEIVEPKFLPP